MRHARLFVFAAAALFSAAAFPWGQEGHRITGYVAQEMLTAKTKQRLNQIIANANLANIALYMDQNKAKLKKRIPGSEKWHYDNEPVCAAADYAEYCKNGDCATTKIPEYTRVLMDPDADQADKSDAVRFIVHMIGDLHQPLHVADDDDAGGNGKTVILPGSDDTPKLHQVWDIQFVRAAMDGLDEKSFAHKLVTTYQSKKSEWQKGKATDWAQESFQLATDDSYGKLTGFACGADPSEDAYALSDDYVKTATDVVTVQMAKAGARIAYTLNRALGK